MSERARRIAGYFTRAALAKARAGQTGRSWVFVRKVRAPVAEMRDAAATGLLREVEMTYHRRDHRRICAALAALAEYLA